MVGDVHPYRNVDRKKIEELSPGQTHLKRSGHVGNIAREAENGVASELWGKKKSRFLRNQVKKVHLGESEQLCQKLLVSQMRTNLSL